MTPPYAVDTVVADSASVDAAMGSRFSARAFAPRPVAPSLVREVLAAASRAPSGTNTQPWKVYVVTGARRERIVAEVCAAHDALRDNPALADVYREEYDYYPAQWVSPYIDRRRENGKGLYGLLGIAKGDKDAMHRQHQRNYRFFDAPVGLFYTVDRIMGRGSLLDYGTFLQNVMLAARARGLHTCPQQAWNTFSSVVHPLIGSGPNEMLVCGMSMGWADEGSAVNRFHTPRRAVDEFTTWLTD